MSLPMLAIGFLVVLGPLVFFHELGHFLMAKRAGIRVLEFGFGFPPRLFKFWQGQGRLAVGGARVVIPANFKGLPPSAAELGLEQPEASKPEGKARRKTSLDAGDYVEIVADKSAAGAYSLRQLTVLDPGQDDIAPVRQETETGARMRGELTEYVPGTIYSFNWLLPLGGFVRMLGEEDPSAPDSFAAAPKRWRTAVLLAGPLTNVLLALVIITAAWMTGYQEPTVCHVEVTGIDAGSPAAAAGLQPQDVVTQADDEPINECGELNLYISARLGQQVTLQVKRGEQTLAIPITPRAPGQYNPSVEGPLGIHVLYHPDAWTVRRATWTEALSNTLLVIATLVIGMLSLPAMILSGAGLSILGPIGISQAGGEAIEMSREIGLLFPILMLVGQVSVAVGMTNLLPLPALDGGRLLFIFFEWIRGRRLDPRKEMIVHLVGLGLLVLVAILISYGDIVRLLSGQRLF